MTGRLDPVSCAFDRIVDQNGAVTETLYDALGAPVRTALHGDQEGTDGDIHRWGADDLVPAADPHDGGDVESALADPTAALGGASTAVFHDLDAFVDGGRPARILRLLRDDPVHDGEGGTNAASALRVELEYLDGLGRTLQRKLKVDPGPAITRDAGGAVIVGPDGRPSEAESAERWATSGFVHYAASGDVLASFERFFTPSSAYEDDDALRSNGVSQRLHYDALGRVVRVDHPDDSVARSVHEAWRELSYDRNDAIVGTDYETARATLPLDDPERIALEQARAHADTPHETWLDVRGRVAVGIEHGEAGSRLETRHEGDPGAGETRLIDARGLVCVERRLDMLGRPMWQRSQDAGETWTLLGWDSRPRRLRDARGVVLRHTYDAAGRAIALHADVPGDGERLVERVVFGDDPSVVDAARRNLRGTRVRVFDDAGVEEVLRRSPFGTRLAETRRFRDEHRQTVDWTDPATVALEAGTWTTEQRLDALGRPWRRILADGTRVDQTFGRLGETTRVEVTTADGTLDAQAVLLDADYDVHGRRRTSTLGNGVTIEHDYRSDDQRLAAVRAIDDGGRRLQDLRYTYDPEGNLVVLDDASQAPGAGGAALAGLAVTAEKHYRHDAHYRLIEATGRAHRALLIGDHASGFGTGPAFKSTRHITLANGVEVERYRRTYAYDAGGNLTQIRHLGTTANWTRDLWVSATSNRSLPALDDGGLPVVDPEASFDTAGQLVRLSHLRTMDWNWRGRLVRSVLIDRGGPGDDDAEYNVYGSAGPRVRRVVERRVDGAMEHADTRFLPGCTIRRVHRVATGNDILVRTTAHVQAAGQALVRLHQWQVDTFGREVDDLAEKRLRYPLADHVGSATLELDADGRVTTAEEFFPFGGTAFIAGDRREVAIKENRFTGALRDDATGFYCFDFRHYAPWIGNWISPDPAGLVDGLNLYRYARNNPVRFVDPTGLDSTISVPGMPQEVRTAITTPGEDARGIVRNYAQNVTVTGADGRTYGFRNVRVVARNGANGRFQRWWVQFRNPYAIEPTVTYDFDDEPLTVTASDDDESDPPAATPGAGAGDRGNGPGAGERGDGDGGGGKNDTTTGPGEGDGTGPGTGDGTADEAPINPGDGTDDDGKDDNGDEGGDDERDRSGVENGSRDPSIPPLLEEEEERKEEKDREADRDPDARRSGGETRDGSRTDPPPGLPTGENGVPWSPELDVTPLDEIPEGAEFTTDPSKVQRDGRGTADGRGTPGDSESPSARPGGVEGGSSSGSAEATGNDQGARGAGAGGGSGAGDPRNTTGQRGLQGGVGSHELPSWLSWIDPALDGLQIGLDVIGLIPGLGEIADGINGVISLARGDYLGASLSFAAMIPFAGWAATAGKFGRRAVRAADAASDVGGALLRHGDEAVDVGRQVGRRTPGGTRPETPAEVYNSAVETSDMVVQQLEHSCGAACARQLLADEGIDVSESLLRRTGFDPNPGKTQGMYPGGVAENLNRLASERGLDMEFVGRFDPDFLPGGNHMTDPEAFVRAAFEGTGGQPFIARQGGHFVIADRFADGMVHLRDPSGLNWPSSATGIRATIDARRFVAAFGNGHFGMVWRR
ncbi:MAG: RHS repeat-associated core domain-containing protein [Acidobacteriota bacterium]